MMTPEVARAMAGIASASLRNEIETTKKVMAAVPDSQLDYKPGEKATPAGKLIWHIMTSEAWFADGILNGRFAEEMPPDPPGTVAEMLVWYDRNVPPLLEKIGGLTGEQLTAPVNFFNVYNLPAVMYLNFCQVHTVHHRGQLSAYLRGMGARVPSIYGGSADEPFEMPAAAS